MERVVIIGTGNVGMSYAFSLLNQRTEVDELFLIDRTRAKAAGEALDLHSTLGYSPTNMKIRVGSYSDCKDANLVVITAGAPQAPGETRMDLVRKNAAIITPIVNEVMASGFNGIILMVTNPLDVMTQLAWKVSGLPHSKVIGSGTVLDSSRLKYTVGHQIKVNPKDIDAYVLGEHGDSSFVPWSVCRVRLQPLNDFISDSQMTAIEERVRESAYEIIKRKGATYYGIGMCLTRITNAILSNERAVLPLSCYDSSERVYYGYPCVVGRNGIERRLDIPMSALERRKLVKSQSAIREGFASIK
ncbi:L-lactate dehydrogenase [Candidatus Saccharibacteria bacterium]|nr:L-lactate dehydrogenase [Candidatus Saccharibacteria bacterium]